MSKKQDSRSHIPGPTASADDPSPSWSAMFQKQQYKDAVKQAKLINKAVGDRRESPAPGARLPAQGRSALPLGDDRRRPSRSPGTCWNSE